MNGAHATCWVVVVLLAFSANSLDAEDSPTGIRVADQPGKMFRSIQEAIDACSDDAVVHIGAGRYDERLKITKPITLIGSGPKKTVIGPAIADRDSLRQKLHDWAIALEDEGRALGKSIPAQKKLELTKQYAELKQQIDDFGIPVIRIDNTQNVALRSLRVTLPGTPTQGSGLDGNSNGIELTHGGLSIVDCAIVGCLGGGVHADSGSSLEIDDCLIAGTWSSGVSVFNRSPGRLRIVNSDIRNCYHNNIWTGPFSDPCTIEGCRISGSAWFGIRYGERQPKIERNAIFENARSGIYAEGDGGIIKQNLLYKNAGGGAACYWESKAQFEGNLFLANEGRGIGVNGACDPSIHRNIFAGSMYAIEYGSIETGKVNLQPLGTYRVTENFFWKIADPVVGRIPSADSVVLKFQPVELPVDANNRTDDPQITLSSDQQIVLDANSPARSFDFSSLGIVSMKSRWPLTDEERAMVPDDGTRDSSKWKMKNK